MFLFWNGFSWDSCYDRYGFYCGGFVTGTSISLYRKSSSGFGILNPILTFCGCGVTFPIYFDLLLRFLSYIICTYGVINIFVYTIFTVVAIYYIIMLLYSLIYCVIRLLYSLIYCISIVIYNLIICLYFVYQMHSICRDNKSYSYFYSLYILFSYFFSYLPLGIKIMLSLRLFLFIYNVGYDLEFNLIILSLYDNYYDIMSFSSVPFEGNLSLTDGNLLSTGGGNIPPIGGGNIPPLGGGGNPTPNFFNTVLNSVNSTETNMDTIRAKIDQQGWERRGLDNTSIYSRNLFSPAATLSDQDTHLLADRVSQSRAQGTNGIYEVMTKVRQSDAIAEPRVIINPRNQTHNGCLNDVKSTAQFREYLLRI